MICSVQNSRGVRNWERLYYLVGKLLKFAVRTAETAVLPWVVILYNQ